MVVLVVRTSKVVVELMNESLGHRDNLFVFLTLRCEGGAQISLICTTRSICI